MKILSLPKRFIRINTQSQRRKLRSFLAWPLRTPRLLSFESLELRRVLTAPYVVNLTPPNHAVDVLPASNLVMTFSEPIQRGTGYIHIFRTVNSQLFEEMSVSDTGDPRITVDGSTVTIDPERFADHTSYYLTIPPSAFKDMDGNNFGGINSSPLPVALESWEFTTGNGDFVVDSNLDLPDVSPGDGLAVDFTGHTTLRAAIMEANYWPHPRTIHVPAGIYSLAISGQDEDAAAQGDLDILRNVSIVGDSPESTLIQGGGLDRVFHVLPDADVKLSNLTIRNGGALQGGGILNQGTLTLDHLNLTSNLAALGGALYTEGTTSITNSSFVKNFGYTGGAIYNRSSILTVLNSTIGENEATTIGGGLVTAVGGNATLTNTTVYANKAQTSGGGISADHANIILKNSIVAGNLAGSNPDLDGSNSYYLSLGHNLIGSSGDVPGFVDGNNGDQVGGASTPLNPHLGAIGTYGISTVVYVPLYNSTAIDRGNNFGVTATDQLGKHRVADGDDDGTSTVDIGAVEFEPLTFIVNSFNDLTDTSPGDGLAVDATGHTTLRAAIMEANTIPAHVRIRVPAGIYSLSIAGQDEDAALRGDLDIAERVRIVGDSATTTIIDSNGIDRVFHVLAGADGKLSNLTIRNGNALLGGGVLNQGTLSLENTNLINSHAYLGGAIYAQGTTSIASSSLINNSAYLGGAIHSQSMSLILLNSTIGENQAGWSGGGLNLDTGTNATLINTTVYANSASATGGGISGNNASIKLKNSIVASNFAGTYRDLYGFSSNYLSLGNNLIGFLSDVPGFVDGTDGDQVGSMSNPLDPHLGSAGTYGGSTIAYPPLINSPTIDHGSNAGATVTDQLGRARVSDGDDNGTDIVDIGAVEYEPLTFIVNSFSDLPDALPGDGTAVDYTGHTTLRAAIMEANTAQARVRIRVPAGLYTLSFAGQFENAALFGDLDITKRVQIIGDGANATLIDGSFLDRVFHVLPGADAKMSRLTIRNGYATQGGGVLNQGILALDNTILTTNTANHGGALYTEGETSIASSSFIQNFANTGGAAYSHSASLTFINSSIGENQASGIGGGLVTDNGGNVTLTNTTVYKNQALTAGGLAAFNATVRLRNTIVAGNLASSNPDLYNSSSTYVSMGNNFIGNRSDVPGFVDGTNGDQVGVTSSPLNPQLGPAGSYGGSTIVYPLLANSSAIDRGNNTGATGTDQLGNPRVTDGDDDGTETVDIGAVEFEPLTFVVNSVSDLPDMLPGDGLAVDATGHTTLRAAIMEANTIQTPVRIRVPAGIYTLSIAGQDDDTAKFGDLDIARKVKIVGDGASSTLIDGHGLDRVFHVLSSADAKFSHLTIRNGSNWNGAGVFNLGKLTLESVNLTDNHAYLGGAIYSQGPTTITNSSLVKNFADLGGAIYNFASLSLANSTIGENKANQTGGGLVAAYGGSITLTNATVYQNQASFAGGLAAISGSITLGNSIVARNLASSNPDLFNSNSTYVSLGNNLIGNPSDVLGFVNGTNGDQVGVTSSPLDPHLGSAGTYGGSTIVYPLLYDSTAIDRGNNAEATTFDQLGNARVVDGDDNGSVRVDIGAVEFQPIIFVVNSYSDLPDISPGDGVAMDETGHTTLRAAIMEANIVQARVRVQVPAGIYTLSLAGQDDDASLRGDFDIAKKVRIIGENASTTIIDGGGLDREFHVLSGGNAMLANLTMRNGNATQGGGIRNQGTLALDNVNLTGNHSNLGGALYTEGTTSITNSSFTKNFGNAGGAIYNRSSILTAINSTIGENEAISGDGGGLVAEEGGNVTLTNATVYANRAQTAGGGLSANYANIILKNSIVAGNLAYTNPDLNGSNSDYYLSLGNNLIGNPGDVPGFINGTNSDQVGGTSSPLNPRLGSAGTYSGSTIVYPPLYDSTAIDRGYNAGATATDQLGKNRVIDGDDDGTSTIDIGAVEYEPLTFIVNSVTDLPDTSPGDGLAVDALGKTTLRAAIMEANTIPERVRIRVPAGIYTLSGTEQDDDTGLRGDVDIAKRVNIIGAGADATILDGSGRYRVFHVLSGGDAKLSGLTIRNGYAAFGGGVLNQGTLALDSVNLTNNRAESGGAIYGQGPMYIANSSLFRNVGFKGGAIYSHSSSLTLLNSTVGENEANWGGGLAARQGTNATLINTTVYANRAPAAGGGISAIDSSIKLKNSIVASNLAGSSRDLHSSNSNYLSMGNNLIGYLNDLPGFVNGANGDQVGSLSNAIDPHLGSAGTYGGSTIVYPLLANSTAIDHGNNVGASATDQQGRARIADGNDDGTDTIDIGAVELQPLTFIVNSFSDSPDTLPGDGLAADATGHTTLRAAIMEANTIQARVRILVPAGLYTLSTGQYDDAAMLGDLDITKRVQIIGDGASTTLIDGSGLDRVFHVLPGADAKMSSLTIRNGNAWQGGGILNQGTLALDNTILTSNHAILGGALYAEGTTSIASSSFIKNFANTGGAAYSHSASLTLINSTIGENEASETGGGLVTDGGGIVSLTNATVYVNKASIGGGLAALNATIRLRNTIVAGNLASSNPDLYNSSSTYVSMGNNFIGNRSDVPGFVDGTNGDQVGVTSSPLNPQLGPAGSYGGSTIVYPLLANSSAIDRGYNEEATTTDQLGNPRVTDGDDDGTETVDIGAAEFEPLTFVVNSVSDLPDMLPGDGLAVDATGHTTLRAAIMEANTIQTPVRIRVPAGVYALSIAGQDDDTAKFGDLDIAKKVKIVGDGASSTLIDGHGFDRVFHVLPSADARLSHLTIRNGSNWYEGGGGVLNRGSLVLDHTNLTNNHAYYGGAVATLGPTTITNSSLVRNSGSIGGAIVNFYASLTLINSTIGENEASQYGGGLVTEAGGNATLTNVTVYANKASYAGGLAAISGRVTLGNSIVAGNLANSNPDLYNTYASYVSLGNNLIGIPSDVLAFVNGTNGDQVGVTSSPLDPHLGSAGTNGGSTIVYPPLDNSTAIDRGNNAEATTFDQLGNARVVDGDDNGSVRVDIGAVEFQPIIFVVNSYSDLPDISPGDGVAMDETGHTTLRAAIMESNTIQARVRVQVPAGIYTLSLAGQDDDASLRGDFDIAKKVRIIGEEASTTIIDGGGLDREFHVLSGGNAMLANLTMRNGNAAQGGGIRNQGTLALDNVNLTGNHSNLGGALYTEGTTSIANSSFTKNFGNTGGAIYNRASILTAFNSTIGENEAIGGDGGGLVTVYGGQVTLMNATVYANRAQTGGGLAANNASITLRNTIVASNLAGYNPDLHASSADYLSLGNNLIGILGDVAGFINGTNGDQVGSYTSPLDPHLGSASNYGGSTIVYPLLINSTAIDRGNNSGATTTDQLGRARITDGNDDGTDTIDIGATEYAPPTFVVNSFSDLPDALPGDGMAVDVTGHTTLRAAIMEANTILARISIRVPAGIYAISTTGDDDNTALRGDLDIANKVQIIGDGASATIIDGSGGYRVFHVLPGADAKLTGLTIRNGNALLGGGVLNQGTLALDKIHLTSNHAHSGGAIYSEGPTYITNSSLVKNSGYAGGAIYSQSASLKLVNSTVGENHANWMGGGLVTENSTNTTLISSTVYANVASVAGGMAALDARITVSNTIVAGNSGGGNPDIYGSNYVSIGNNLIGYSSNVVGFSDGTNGDQVGTYSPLAPHLGPLGTFGGATSIYPLLPNSTAIDRGNNGFASETDQLGRPRVTDGDDDGTDTVDIGAVEFEPLTFSVNSFRDLPDILPGDGKAVDATGHTTLRAAIMEANTIHARVRIRVPAGIYALSSAGQDDDTAAVGDLDIAKKVKIVGDNASSTIIDGSGFYRVFHVLPGADASLSNLTIRNGNDSHGGGVFSQGLLVLDKTNLTNNHSQLGGAIYAGGTTTITNSSLVRNFGYTGGAIYSFYASLTLVNSTIGENEASETGGGLVAEYYGNVTLTNSTVYANTAPNGGGLASRDASITLRNTIVADNRATNYPDLYGNGYTSMGNNLIGYPSGVTAFVDGTNGDQVGGYPGQLSLHLGPAGTYGGSVIGYPPLNNSTAIDRGDNVNATTTDQLGNARVIDGDDNGTEIIDIGAVEFASPTFIVNSFSDLPDTLPGDGLAVDETGQTTLRAAIMEANTVQTRVVIRVPAGIYVLTTAGKEDDTGAIGDLDIAKKVRIIGDDAGMTLIDGSGLDRVFHVLLDADAQLSNLTIRNGNASLGGGIRNQGSLTLHNSNLTSNHAELGGAIYSEGPTSLTNSSFVKNSANVAGAVYNRSSMLAALNSTIGENHANSGGGLVSEYGGSVTLTNVTVYGNEAYIAGGVAALSASITLTNSIVAGNLSEINPDLYDSNSSYLSLGNNLIGNPSGLPGFINGTNGDQVGSISSPLDPRLGFAGVAGSLTIVYAPSYDSLAVDHGNNVGATATDQVGKARVTDGDDDGIGTIDIGAIEFQIPNHRPRINSVATPNLPENLTDVMTIVVTDTDLPVQVIAFSITGGADKSKFNITPNGVLQFIASPDFENPTDTNFDNLYLVQVTANDGHGGIATQDLSVTVTPVNDNNPVFTSTNTPNVPENTTAVLTVTSTDADLPAQVVAYSITGGADRSKFSITPGGILSFVAAPVYSNPTDVNADNLYLVQVTANDGMGGSTVQNLVVAVVDVTAPTVSVFSPTDDAIGVSRTANLVLTFSEPIQKGTGNIAIRRGSDNSTFLSLPVSDNAVQSSGSTVTIDPTDFESGTSYYVEIPAGAFKDLAGNNFAGISGPTTWNFASVRTATFTVSGPTLLLDLNSPNTTLAIYSAGTSYQLILSESLWIGTDSNNLSGNGTATLTLASSGLLAIETIRITDSATNDSIIFLDSGTNTYSDNFSIVLDNAGAGDIEFLGTTAFAGGSSLNASTTNGINLLSGSQVRTASGNITFRGKVLDGTSATVTSVSGSITSYVDAINLLGTTTFQTTGAVSIATNSAGTSIDLGGTDRPGYLGLTDAEVDRVSAGSLLIGDANSQAITISAAITSNTNLALTSGSGGIVSTGGSLGTSGTSIGLNTPGGIGTSASRLLFADQTNTLKQNIIIGTSLQPSSVYLGGWGSLTLGGISGGNTNTTIDVTAVTNLVVATGATINGGNSSVKLGADLTNLGGGDDGFGTLKIGDGASVLGNDITLIGADEEIANTAMVGAGSSSPLIATLTGLNNPRALTYDSNGNLFVANTSGSTVSMFTPEATTPVATLTGLNGPNALAFDGFGNLFVANSGSNTVSKFEPGALSPSATLTGLDLPFALAFDRHGNLFVANMGGHTVSMFVPGALTASTILTGVSSPRALAFDSVGNLYVANLNLGNGTTVSKFAPGAITPSATLTGLTDPIALAFDSSDNLFVANLGIGTVSKFAPGSTSATDIFTGLTLPIALAVDSSDNLFVANFGTNGTGTTVSKFSPGSNTPTDTLTGLSRPFALAKDSRGHLAVANASNGTVSKFNLPGNSTVTLRPSVANRLIDLGSNTSNTFALTDAELDRISASTVRIGDSSSGRVTFRNSLTPAGIGTMSVASGSEITQGFAGDVLAGGATLLLKGNLAPALDGTGTFVVNGNTAFDATASFKANLNGTSAYDQLIVSGNARTINLNGIPLAIALDKIPDGNTNEVYRIIDSTGTGSSVVGKFTYGGLTLDDSATFMVGNTAFHINYNPSGSSGDVILSVNATAPRIVSLLPADNSNSVSLTSNLILNFNVPIQLGAGQILIKKSSDNVVFQTLDVSSGRVTVVGSTVTIDSNDFAPNTSYYVEVTAGAFKDLLNNNFIGISGTATWNFTTKVAAVACGPTAFFDGFEGQQLDPFWTKTETSGFITIPSSVQVHSGSRSLQLNSTSTGSDKWIHLDHIFPDGVYGTFSVWLYDTGADVSSSNYFQLYLEGVNDTSAIGTNDYDLGPGNNGATYYYTKDSIWTPSILDRTKAWHKFEITTAPAFVKYVIDGSTIYTETSGMAVKKATLNMFGPSWRPAFVGYFDDFSFIPSNITTVNFDQLDATVSPQTGEALANYLGACGLTLKDVTPGTQINARDARQIYPDVQPIIPSSPFNVLTQEGLNAPVSYTLESITPLSSFQLTRPAIHARPSGVLMPQWTATALDANGNVLGSVGETQTSIFVDRPAATFTLNGPHIASIRVNSDGHGSAALSAIVLDNLVLVKEPVVVLSTNSINENLASGGVVGNLTLSFDNTSGTNFALVAGQGSADNSSFTIDPSGILKTIASLNYEAKPTYSIRVRATNSSGQIEQVFNISVNDLPELVGSAVLGDGTSQHSSINKLTILLDGAVTVAPGAFTLVQRESNAVVTTQVTQTPLPNGQSQLTLTFSGPLTRGAGALSDGYYQLTIDGSKILRGSVAADLNGDGIGGDGLVIGAAESDKFFALYGDTDGDGVVGVAEFGAFRAAFGKSAQDAGYNALFDYELDQSIGVSDFGQFRSRFGKPKLKF